MVMSKKQGENISKRQIRKEELRKKERQQRIIVISALVLVVVVFAVVIYVSTRQASINATGGPINKIALQEFKNAKDTTLGDPNAKVKIDVFEDFQCIHCKDYTENVEPQIISQLVDTGRVYYVFHQYPFLDSPDADQSSHRAALASECAAEQNDFWNFKKMLFANYTGVEGEFSEVRLEAFAKLLNLNVTQFKTCLTSAKYQAKLDEGMNLGTSMGVKGTPNIFVNGVSVAPSINEILAAVLKAEQSN
jgi:protein-disulfide isomerase